MPTLTRTQRRDSILDAARDILYTSGLDAITMPEIATRVGVSRQVLYLHFHSVDEVIGALYDSTFKEYFEDLEPIDVTIGAVTERGVDRLVRLMNLPPAIHRINYSAFFASPNSRPALVLVQRRMMELVQENWIEPLVAWGLEREVVVSGMFAIFAATMEFRELIDAGLIQPCDARIQLHRMATALFANTPTR